MTIGTTPISASFPRSKNDDSDSEAAESSRTEKDAARVVQDEETTVDMESYELPSAKFPTFESNSN
jgi:hypothetical protein